MFFVGCLGLTHFGLTHFGLIHFGLSNFGLTHFGLSNFGLTHFGLTNFALRVWPEVVRTLAVAVLLVLGLREPSLWVVVVIN